MKLNQLPVKRLPKISDEKIVAQTRLFTVEQLNITFSNNEKRVYERLVSTHLPGVIVVALFDDETLLLIQEYAAGRESYEVGLPKGGVEKGETIEQAANRELMEEAGYGANKLTILTEFAVVPAYMQHRITVVLAEDLYPQKRAGDEPEDIAVLQHPLADIDELIAREDFNEARTFAAIYLARDVMQKRKQEQ